MADPIEEVQAQLDAAASRGRPDPSDAVSSVRDFISRMHAADRSFIAKLIIGLYAFVIVVSLLYLVTRGWNAGENVFDDVMELVKVAVLPIVALSIGYYFGTKSE